jgi:hypothetical protein
LCNTRHRTDAGSADANRWSTVGARDAVRMVRMRRRRTSSKPPSALRSVPTYENASCTVGALRPPWPALGEDAHSTEPSSLCLPVRGSNVAETFAVQLKVEGDSGGGRCAHDGIQARMVLVRLQRTVGPRHSKAGRGAHA